MAPRPLHSAVFGAVFILRAEFNAEYVVYDEHRTSHRWMSRSRSTMNTALRIGGCQSRDPES